jgi:hypothetical protein
VQAERLEFAGDQEVIYYMYTNSFRSGGSVYTVPDSQYTGHDDRYCFRSKQQSQRLQTVTVNRIFALVR